MGNEGMVRKLDRAADGALGALSLSLVGLVLVAVFFRYGLNRSLSWSDEVVRYLFVWCTLLGAAVTLREREHIRVEYFVELLPLSVRRTVDAAVLWGVCLFQVALVVLGVMWVWSTRGSYTSALQWPLNLFFYAALPCTAALGAWYALRRLLSGAYSESDVTDEKAGDAAQEGDTWKS